MKERDIKVLEQNKTKTFEGEFIYELLNSYDLPPCLKFNNNSYTITNYKHFPKRGKNSITFQDFN